MQADVHLLCIYRANAKKMEHEKGKVPREQAAWSLPNQHVHCKFFAVQALKHYE